jgi:hypothetical protein
MVSKLTLSLLPDVPSLKKLSQSLAMLDAILSPEWEYRYYSFNSKWAPGERMASMRNGSGDEYFILFDTVGVPEVWRFHENRLLIYQLASGAYSESQASRFLPGVTANDATRLIELREKIAPNAWQRKVSEYAQQIQRGK